MIPFSFDRNSRSGLARQLADGFRRAIVDGLYQEGEILPTIRELSAVLKVSEITVRGAMKRLTADGLISPRRGIGAVVTGRCGRLNRGRVLIVTMELSPNYCHSVMLGVLRQTLVGEGYLPYQVSVVKDSDGKVGYSQLDQLMGETVSLAIVFGSHYGVWQRLERAGIRTLVVGRADTDCVCCEDDEAVSALIDHCRSANVERIVFPLTPGASQRWFNVLSDAGLTVEKWLVRHAEDASSLQERVYRGSFRHFMRRLKQRNPRLPDVFFFIDDFVAAGALSAMDLSGVRVPEDVRVVTWRAKGSLPFYRKTLTCLEEDPEEGGRILSARALAILSGRRAVGMRHRMHFFVGETFP